MVKVEEIDPAQEFLENLLTRHKAMNEATERGDSAVQQFYNGATVFVTGGSGFLGKQFIEKLFRATKVSKIFLLLRTKKGKPKQQRLNEMLEDPVYDMLKEQQPDFADKIVPVAGDVAELKLGMSDEDWKTVTEQVDIIFHMAATTRFDETLRVATMINVRGAREALLLGKDCKKLKSYVHVSTAYSYACENMIDTEVLEDFYKTPVDPESLIKMAETVDEERLNDMTASFIKNWPNTYSFAKAVAEETVRSLSDGLPICVVRPAIVTCAQREPCPGWLDMSNVYGASGVIIGPGLGLMHAIIADDKTRIGLIPVDYVNNAIIVAAWETAKKRAAGDTKTKIYTVTSSTRNLAIWGGLHDTLDNVTKHNYMSPATVFFQFVVQTTNPVLFWIYSWLLHLLPAYIIDGVCLALGKERRFVRLYRKMYKLSTALSYFTVNHWQFVDKNTAKLYDNMSTVDKEIFDFDVKKLDWVEYMCLWCIGLRKYIIKDGLTGSKYAVKKQFGFKIIAYIIAPIYFYCLYKVLSLGILVISLFVKMFY